MRPGAQPDCMLLDRHRPLPTTIVDGKTCTASRVWKICKCLVLLSVCSKAGALTQQLTWRHDGLVTVFRQCHPERKSF
jgi:hypothetical protein